MNAAQTSGNWQSLGHAPATRDEGGPVAVQLDPQLMDILACPAEDHGPLRSEGDADILVCTVCGRRYPVEDGIPVLLLDRAIP